MSKRNKNKRVENRARTKQFEDDLELLNSLEKQYTRDLRSARSEDERQEALARLEWVQKRRRGLKRPGRRP